MKNILKKIGTLIITLLVVSFLTFIAFEVIPGDSVTNQLGMDATKEQVEALREELGYNDPIVVRYGNWLRDVLQGDFGTSSRYNVTVEQLVGQRLPVTVGLALLSILLIVIISLPLGIFSAGKRGSRFDSLIVFMNQLGMAIPPFFMGMIITLLFGLIFKWFTPGKLPSIENDFGGFVYYLMFPAVAIAIPKIAMLVKFLRSSVLRQIELDYVRTAKSKGLKYRSVLYRHVLKNALIPVITFLAMMIAEVLAGSIIVEQVFNLPGLGRLLIVAISNRDYTVVQAIVLYITTIVLVMNMIVDILYEYLDPRVRLD